MRALGALTAALMGLVLAEVVVIGVRSVPDIKRYLAMRRM
jgi:TRAP-type mannitol/chloroaromatic compound transport system permease large subunit